MDSEEKCRTDPECQAFLVEVAFNRLQLLEDTTESIDRKAGTLLGFVSVVVIFALQLARPDLNNLIDALFVCTGFASLFVSLVLLISCLRPRNRRMDPEPEKMLEAFWRSRLDRAREEIAASLVNAWRFNTKANGRKATLFAWAVWLSVAGIGFLAVNEILFRAIL